MASSLDCVQQASDNELVAELAGRINRLHLEHKARVAGLLAQGKADEAKADVDVGEGLIDMLLEQANVAEFEHYWKLGDLIYDENPYFRKDQIEFDFDDQSKIRRAGVLANRNADRPFHPTTERENIPKPPEMGGPSRPAQTYYFRIGRNTGEVPKADETPEKKEELERNILKELEIAYGPPIPEFQAFGADPSGKDDTVRKLKVPHIIVLYCGGDH